MDRSGRIENESSISTLWLQIDWGGKYILNAMKANSNWMRKMRKIATILRMKSIDHIILGAKFQQLKFN